MPSYPIKANDWFTDRVLSEAAVWSAFRQTQREWYIRKNIDPRKRKSWLTIERLLQSSPEDRERAIVWIGNMLLWDAVTSLLVINRKGKIRLRRDLRSSWQMVLSIIEVIKISPRQHILQKMWSLGYFNRMLVEYVGNLDWSEVPHYFRTQILGILYASKMNYEGVSLQGTPSYAWYYNARPRHYVHLHAYEIGVFPVTQAVYFSVIGYNPSFFRGSCLPVDGVSWFDAVRFCNRLSIVSKLPIAYVIGTRRYDIEGRECTTVTSIPFSTGYRLPTEAEWECAARGGEECFYSGENVAYRVAWFKRNSSGKTHIVGQKKPNKLGVFDMSGNVWEWCWDRYGSYDQFDLSEPLKNPMGPPTGPYRIIRGGCYNKPSRYTHVACRGRTRPHNKGANIGFRIVRTL